MLTCIRIKEEIIDFIEIVFLWFLFGYVICYELWWIFQVFIYFWNTIGGNGGGGGGGVGKKPSFATSVK
jgi:hypothetical protein